MNFQPKGTTRILINKNLSSPLITEGYKDWKYLEELGTPVIPATWRLRQEDHKGEDSLSNLARH